MVSAFGDAIDAKSGAAIYGGSFVGVGTAKTPQGFSGQSSQRALLFTLSGGANTSAQVVSDASGEVVGTVEARCGYTYVIYSTESLTGGSYRLVLGTLSASAQA